MSDYNNYEDDNTECECITCQLTEEFKQMIQDDVEWELALRHILGVMSSEVAKSDEEIADLVDESFIDGFTQGMATGVAKAQLIMDSLVEDTDERIAEIRAEFEIDEDFSEDADGDEIEKVEDLTDEQYESIQDILRKNM